MLYAGDYPALENLIKEAMMKKRFYSLKFIGMSLVIIGLLFVAKLHVYQTAIAQNSSDSKLTLQILTEQNSYVELEPVSFELKLLNQTNQPIKWKGLLMFGPSLTFIARNANGQETRLDGKNLTTGLFQLNEKIIQAGNEFQNKELIGETSQLERLFPGPGRYEVRAEFTYKNTELNQNQQIVSAPVAFEINEPVGIDRQARDYIKNVYERSSLQDTRLKAQLQQDLVNRFGSTVYGKYLIFNLAGTYRAIGDDIKAEKELLKISNASFYYSKQVKSTLAELAAKLHPVPLTELPEDAPLPEQSPSNPQ